MTIDEVLSRIKDKFACDYNINGCDTCDISSCEDRDIIIQLSEWLEELKAKRNIGECAYKQGYNKAIDDCIDKFADILSNIPNICGRQCPVKCNWGTEGSCKDMCKKWLAEQLKGGAEK